MIGGVGDADPENRHSNTGLQTEHRAAEERSTQMIASAGDPMPLSDYLVAEWSRVFAGKRLFIRTLCLGRKSYVEAMPGS